MLKADRGFRNGRIWHAHVIPAAILGLGVLVLMCGPAVRSQFGAGNPFGKSEKTQHDFPHESVSNQAGANQVITEQQRVALNVQRQKQLVADSDRLLKLAQELNDEVGASGSRSLTAEQVEKLSQIEKLARSVRDGMLDKGEDPEPSVSRPQI